jgi:hypothetical protein
MEIAWQLSILRVAAQSAATILEVFITCGLFGISAYLNIIKVIVRFPNQAFASGLQYCSHFTLSTVSLISIVDQAQFWIGVLLSFWLLIPSWVLLTIPIPFSDLRLVQGSPWTIFNLQQEGIVSDIC